MGHSRLISSVSDFGHLVARFLDAVLARRLAPLEQAEVAAYLRSPVERVVFWDQPTADQRHGLEAARWVAARHPDRDDLIRAALLHDIGKRHARLGPVGRSRATLRMAIGLQLTPGMSSYGDHGKLGAAELESAGAEPLVAAYARHHHGERPAEIDPLDWRVLVAADRAFLPWLRMAPGGSRRARPASLPPFDGASAGVPAGDGPGS